MGAVKAAGRRFWTAGGWVARVRRGSAWITPPATAASVSDTTSFNIKSSKTTSYTASFAKEIAYGPVNNDAYAMIDAELANWLPGAPDKVKQQVYQDYGWWNQLSDGKSNWDRAIERCSRMLAPAIGWLLSPS